ncbi:MAG TPA: cytochrome b N-terminal domain-containing protein [Anaerolineae bacterium]|nr:cytochrome b N-terminal domain-containing protein [Anaerolineae bacterium]
MSSAIVGSTGNRKASGRREKAPPRAERGWSTATSLILHLHPPRVSASALRFTYTWGLGGISALLACLLAFTGVLLLFRYEPSVERAYLSIRLLESQVPFGALFRAIHHWSANLLVITSFLHLVRVFLSGGFKKGRAANWVIGMLLLIVALAMNFTGYLLPWDQLAYWAITVSTSLAGYVPVVGTAIGRLLLAGSQVGQGALSNFYAFHVAVLPSLFAVALSYHFWKVRKDGGISQPEAVEQRSPRVDTIPHLVQREVAVGAVVLVAVVLFSMLVPAPLGQLADPMNSPNPAKAAWYFAGLQELLLHMHPLAAIALVLAVIAAVGLLPYWEREHASAGVYFRSHVGRQAAILGTLLATSLVPVLVVLDEFWFDLPALLPTWPLLISSGLLPLLITLAGLAAVYALARFPLKASHTEAVVALIAFVVTALVVLTVVGVYFRGPNMALVLPF